MIGNKVYQEMVIDLIRQSIGMECTMKQQMSRPSQSNEMIQGKGRGLHQITEILAPEAVA